MSKDWSPKESFIADFVADHHISQSAIYWMVGNKKEYIYNPNSDFSDKFPNLSFIVGENCLKELSDKNPVYLLYVDSIMEQLKNATLSNIKVTSESGKSFTPDVERLPDNIKNKYIQSGDVYEDLVATVSKYVNNDNDSYYQDENKNNFIFYLKKNEKAFTENIINNVNQDLIRMQNQGLSYLESVIAINNEFSGLITSLECMYQGMDGWNSSVSFINDESGNYTIAITNDGDMSVGINPLDIEIASGSFPKELIKNDMSFEQMSLTDLYEDELEDFSL